MALAAGSTLGHYEVQGLIGKGGMGEVYRGYDTKLQRDVALKLLPPQFARDPERLARFRREATMLAALNHPNIAQIYGVEDSGDTHYLVMEFVPGLTLADRVIDLDRAGPVEVDEALRISSQICEALEHAHEKNIIHRDLKPANVKLTPEGKVKVLDFGLAKAFAGEASDHAPLDSNSPTLGALPSASPTLPGVILGTAAYMSPEQAKGKTVDRRTDIWALGCVLYELLTRRAAFSGESVTEILGSVFRAEPDWALLPEATPSAIRALLRRCLRKDSQQRPRDAADIRLELDDARAAASPSASALIVQAAAPAPRRWLLLGALACVVVAAIATAATWYFKPAPPLPVTRTVVAMPADQRLVPTGPIVPLALSPDGSQMAYISQKGSELARMYLRAMNSLEDRPFSGTETGDQPFFSPDGQWIGFSVGATLKKVPITGGAVLTICPTNAGLRGASWGPDNKIIFGTNAAASGLFQVSSAGGTPEVLSSPDTSKGEASHRWPEILPGGKAVLFVVGTGGGSYDDAAIVVQRLDTGERKVLLQGGTFPHYAPTGHLVYYRAGTVMALPFDLDRLEPSGSPAPVIEGVRSSGSANAGGANFALSSTGALAYIPGSPQGGVSTLVWVDRRGASTPLKTAARSFGVSTFGSNGPRLSPDGQSVAVQINDQKSDIWIYSIPRETMTRLTFEGNNLVPGWTPDGKRVVFQSTKEGPLNLFWKPADGSGPDERLAPRSDGAQYPGSFTPDGRTLVYAQIEPKTGRDIFVLPLDGDPGAAGTGGKPSVFLQTPYNETTVRFSPDGRWVAYVSDASGRNEVYVQPFPGPGGKYQVSTEGGTEMVWGANGEIFYRAGNKMLAVEVKTQPILNIGRPQVLFEAPYLLNAAGGAGANYDVTTDGQRFLMLKGNEQGPAATQINVVLNWFEELKAKVPVN